MALLKLFGGRLRVYLAADQVGVVREPGLLRGRVECASVRVAPDDAAAPSWKPAVSALAELIASRGWRGLPIEVAVSSEFVRIALVTGIRRQLSATELQGLAHGMFARVLGDSVADWNVRYCAGDRETVLAAATEKSLVSALEDLARACAGSLRSVSPLWSCAVNGQRARLAHRSAWLVLAESRAAAFGLLERGSWKAMRIKSLDTGRGLGVAPALERESRFLGTQVRDVIVVGEPQSEGFSADWKVEHAPFALTRFGALPPECRPAALAGI